ncbi:MAG: hypothetical protein V3W34_04605 [Phycisphaerae bacterium]
MDGPVGYAVDSDVVDVVGERCFPSDDPSESGVSQGVDLGVGRGATLDGPERCEAGGRGSNPLAGLILGSLGG